MKKLLQYLAIFTLVFTMSCSTDDQEDPEVKEEKTTEEKLVDESPWKYSKVEVLRIILNSDPPKSKNEMEAFVNEQFNGFSFSFNQDGTGRVIFPDDHSESFNYTVENGNIVFTGVAFGTMQDVNITDNVLNYTVTQTTGDGENPDNDIEFEGKFTYN